LPYKKAHKRTHAVTCAQAGTLAVAYLSGWTDVVATGDVHASPAFDSGTLYVGSWDSYFYAIDAATGKEKGRFHGGEGPMIHNQMGFQSSPVVVDGDRGVRVHQMAPRRPPVLRAAGQLLGG
jgi:outer membrane protein assembly factor BamB